MLYVLTQSSDLSQSVPSSHSQQHLLKISEADAVEARLVKPCRGVKGSQQTDLIRGRWLNEGCQRHRLVTPSKCF
jgi:hypothetical protein